MESQFGVEVKKVADTLRRAVPQENKNDSNFRKIRVFPAKSAGLRVEGQRLSSQVASVSRLR
jgi:hypothetical protein